MTMLHFLAESYLHQMDPFVVRFTETFGIRWYGLAYLAGFLIAWAILQWLARTGRTPLSPQEISDYVMYGIVGVLVGGRLGYCIFYDQRLLWDPPLIGIIQIWRGGMASHGGFIGVVVATWLFARRRKTSALHILDMGALACPLGLGLGRLANFVNGELWGKALPAALQKDPPWWSVKYPDELLGHGFLTEERLESLGPLFGGKAPSIEDVVLAVRSGQEAVVEAVRPWLTAYHPSQIYQALSDGPILFLAMVILWLFPLKPGGVSGGFLITYGILRIATEVFRQPDEGVALLPTPWFDLSRGQLLSILMVIAGIALIVYSVRRDARPMGSLLRPRKV
ncbi:MAG: prolipoprotein diacylglyceryl transferase [Planctomycetes bacterium]|nr:prolipoprotein diacylglyceryl transferase [Planctomycetota bacterium]